MEFLDGFSCCSPLLASGQRCEMWVGVCFHDTAWQILCNRNGLTTERRLKSMSEVGCIRKGPNRPEGGDYVLLVVWNETGGRKIKKKKLK